MVEELQRYVSATEELCRRHAVVKLDVIGSAARGDFNPATSDFDFLVTFEPERPLGFGGAYFQLLQSLEELLGRKFDLIEEPPQEEFFLRYATRDRKALYAA
jgi:predicted nucleotidyltransferase